MECGKLRKLICSNKATVENLKQFAERLEEKPIKSSVDDLPNILPAIFNYAFHKDTSFRQSALPAFIKLTNLLDLNKHLKEQQWWSQLKEQMIQKVDILMELITSGDENWSNLWCTTITMLGSDLKGELVLLNKLLKVVEKAFKMSKEDVKDQGFKCWRKLISNFAINKQELNNKRRLTLLVIPLKAGNHATHRLCVSKMETWKYLLYNLDQESEMTVQLVIVHFLEFMFGGVGSLAPACKMLNTECGKAFWQLLKTLFVFRSLPDIFIKYAILCIEHIIENVDLALDIWKCLLNNMKLLQWPDNLVATLVTEIVNSGEKNAVFKKSETYAQLVRNLYTGNQSIPVGLLVKNIDKIITVAFEPDVLLNFTESWCNDLLEIVDQTDPITLPQDVMGIIVPKLIALSTGEVFRDEKVKLLRGIWMTVINIYCKWTFSEGLRDKNGSTQSDLHNIYQLLLYGATDLSSTWNKFQIKSWKSLYSEGVKHFSLLPEADKFVSGLVQLLVDGVRNGKLPFHVAVDVVSILLEFHLSKDASSIRPLMMELAEKGMNLLQIDPSSSILLGTYIKIIVSAARSESALVNDVSAVIDKMSTNSKETLSGGSHDKIRNMVFKAQHQLHGLKSTRIQEKSDSPNTSTTPTSSSPTMTSFLRRLAKSKESKAKLSSTSPSQSLEKSPSPAVTPTSKKTNSPFADLKSEDFVFVPPKNRKTILTDHQKESLNSRKHDIPALYQDLSQDNSQSAFESIVTSVQVVEEDVDKLHFVHTPKKQNGSIELGLKVLTPKEVKNSTSGIEVREPEESKLLSNKENDCFNNNTNSPFSSVGKQDKLVSKDMSSFNTVLPNDDSKKCEDNSLAVVVDGNKPLQEMKNVESKLSDNKKSSNIKTCESTLKEVSKRDKKENEDLKTSVEEKSECKKTSEIEPCSKANKTVSESLATETTVNSVIDHKTPKRNFKRSKIILSVKKSQKKDNTKSPKISEEEISLTPDNKERKSPRNSNNTPKVSPRRLRKRKSGVTPILSAGELSKKKKSVQSPLSSKTTPVVKIAECTEIKKAFNEDSEDVNNCNRNKCIGSTNGINSEKPCMVTSEESSTGTKSVVGEECEKTDKISEKLIMKKDNINVDIKFSPVKVVLARIPLNDSSSCSNINNRLCGPSSEKPNKSCGEPVSGRIKDPIKLSDRKNQVDDSTEGLINADTGVDHSKKNSHSVIGNNTETEGSVKEVTTNLKEVRKGDEEISVKCTVATKSNTSEQKTHEDICTNSESKQSAEIEQTPPVKRRYSPLIITRSMETNNKSIDTSHTSGKNYTTTKNVSSGDTSIKVPVECSAAVTTVKSEAENSNDCNKLYDSANKDGKSLLDKESISTPQKSVVELKTNSTAGGNNDMKNSSKESESLCVVESSPSQNTRSSVKKTKCRLLRQ
ncbi:telomere-associated protein RIF1 [Homalodisca vitripennis]|uniref:telomere-associated protein RIF1 n=1 Tax=Homalodisca vitripennis TaxID=197043 RepID=UPI001EEBDE35|nr:telomere-associated protein RIF1 [Homalodisca vitripennis]